MPRTWCRMTFEQLRTRVGWLHGAPCFVTLTEEIAEEYNPSRTRFDVPAVRR